MPVADPVGWFGVGHVGRDLQNGQIKTMRYFGTEFVIWRGGDGAAARGRSVLPAYGRAPGRQQRRGGNDLRCPYHHWRFNGEGGVTKIPYTDVDLAQHEALVPADLAGRGSRWRDLRLVSSEQGRAEVGSRAHSRPAPKANGSLAGVHDWVVNIHCREIPENGQDYQHFGAVHGVPGPPEAEFRIEGWTRRNNVVAEMNTPRGPMDGHDRCHRHRAGPVDRRIQGRHPCRA